MTPSSWPATPSARCSTACSPRTPASSVISCRTTAGCGPSSTCTSTTPTSASSTRPPRLSPRATCSRSCRASPAGGPAVETELPKLAHAEVLRYSRHLLLPEVGLEGQRKLKAARVLTIGAGGLGSPLSLYLAAAGVGTIGIVDFDVVDLTNLQRQIVHGTSTLGTSEARLGQGAAHRPQSQRQRSRRTRRGSRPRTRSTSSATTTSSSTAPTTSRPAISSTTPACCWASPTSTAASSASRARRRSSTPRKGPCYRCLYPEPPPPGLVPSCAEGGVLGVLPGIIGSIQALETIKLIIGAGDSLIGRLVLFDALKLRFRELKLRKDPDCPICGDEPDDPRADRLRGVLRHRRGARLQRARDLGGGVQRGARRQGRRSGSDRRARAARVGDRPHRRRAPDSAGPAPRPPGRARRPRGDRDAVPQGRAGR